MERGSYLNLYRADKSHRIWTEDPEVIFKRKLPDLRSQRPGPNISDPPVSEPFPDQIKGVCAIKVGDKITTDDIFPVGFRLKFRSNIPNMSSFTFELIDKTFATRALENED